MQFALGSEERVISPNEQFVFDIPGAGIVIRRDIADGFANQIEYGRFAELGRRGQELASGDDAAICRYAAHCGASLGYAPALNLLHIIPKERTGFIYLTALIERIGRSAAMVDEMFGTPTPPLPIHGMLLRHLYHFARHGPIGWATVGWHRGYRHHSLGVGRSSRTASSDE